MLLLSWNILKLNALESWIQDSTSTFVVNTGEQSEVESFTGSIFP